MIEYGKLLESYIAADDRFELTANRKFALVCFRLKSTNENNKKLLDTILSEKNMYLASIVAKSYSWFERF